MSVNTAFAARLKKLREIVGLNQTQLSEKLGVSRGSISYYENNERTPDINFLDTVSKFFDVPFEYLMGYTDSAIKENVDINSELSLSDISIEKLKKIDFDITILNMLIEHEDFEKLLGIIEEYTCVEEDIINVDNYCGYMDFLIAQMFLCIVIDIIVDRRSAFNFYKVLINGETAVEEYMNKRIIENKKYWESYDNEYAVLEKKSKYNVKDTFDKNGKKIDFQKIVKDYYQNKE